MATITIKDATVAKIFGQSYQGASVYEVIEITSGKRKGETFKRYYTLWSKGREPFEFDENDVVTVTGEMSVQVEEYEDKNTGEVKHSAKVTVNDAVVLGSEGADHDDDEDAPF